jgi:hypothetical protein
MSKFLLVLLGLLTAHRLFAQNINVKFVDRTIIEDRLREAPRKNKTREQLLRQHFEEAGCDAEHLIEQHVSGSTNPNVMCTLVGEVDRTIIVGAHFDFVDAGTGIIDNWSGAALLPILYEAVAATPRRHRFVFISFTDEEKGLVGSAYFVHETKKQDLAKLSAMVTMDSLATSPTKVELIRGDKDLLRYLSIAANTLKVPLSAMDVHNVGRSDSDSLQDKHVPTVCIHSMTQQTFSYLHSREDRIDHVDFPAYYDSYRLVALYLAYLDQILDVPHPPAEAGK